MLTNREQEVANLIAQGLFNKEIALVMGIGLQTVKFHVKNIMQKLHCRNRVEVAIKVLGN